MPSEIEDVNQGTMSGGAHWRVLAEQSVSKVFGCLEGLTYWNEATETHEPYCRQDVDRIRYTPIFVEQADSGTPFGEALHRNLRTAVAERGLELSLAPGGALRLATRVQVVDRAHSVPLHAWPGHYTMLGAGVAALGLFGAPGAVAAGAAADAMVSGGGYGGAQVLVTTMLLDGQRMVMSKSDAYYIENVDLAHYASTAPAADLATPMKDGAEPPSVHTMNVVEE